MIVHDVQQGSPQWLQLRLGLPTASEFDSILTPGGKPSKAAEKYLFALLAEKIMGHPRIEAVSTWMSRGSEMESEAVEFYELQRNLDTVPVGFITNDAGTIGASPDRLVGDEGLLEIKCPSEPVHVSYLIKKSVDQAYFPQIQGQLWIAERKWADIVSYNPEMPPALIHVERDEVFIKLLAEAVSEFAGLLEAAANDLAKRGWIKVPPAQPTKAGDGAALASLSAEARPEKVSGVEAGNVGAGTADRPAAPHEKKLAAWRVEFYQKMAVLKKIDEVQYRELIRKAGYDKANLVPNKEAAKWVYHAIAAVMMAEVISPEECRVLVAKAAELGWNDGEFTALLKSWGFNSAKEIKRGAYANVLHQIETGERSNDDDVSF